MKLLWLLSSSSVLLCVSASNSCSSSSDCGGEDEFCSSKSFTCEVATCVNWASGPPAGETPFSEEPCIAEGAPAGSAFCGWDGSCYTYTCDNWYKYGPVEYTSHDVTNPVRLDCQDYTTGAADNMNSVVFGCRPYQPGSKAPEGKTWTHFFNQKCTAKPHPDNNDEFICYQNNIARTDYTDFLGEVSRINQNSCDRETYDNEQPLYWYIVQVQQERRGVITKHLHGRDNTASSTSFDASEADKTMFARLISNTDPITQPTLGSAASPASSSDAAATTNKNKGFGWTSILAAAGALAFLGI
ncbi:expressed unknown protein [Seminavis robusta]|uniref:Secreted protein n=1 Tax=Seminavis robusta TaxID=568900 RepID=A0A9N8EJ48_9STRA|nr:expressed unknown protein [Seminavis robusta]|eukprot:Sro1082_g239230.1 n/a (300) ;mRNA; f:27499-28398